MTCPLLSCQIRDDAPSMPSILRTSIRHMSALFIQVRKGISPEALGPKRRLTRRQRGMNGVLSGESFLSRSSFTLLAF